MTKDVSRRILLLNHDQNETATISQILLLNKYQVLRASNNREAMALVKKSTPDLIITNARSNGIDVEGLIGILRSDPKFRRIPVLFVVEQGDSLPVELAALNPGHPLMKPFTREQLAIAVQKNLKCQQSRPTG